MDHKLGLQDRATGSGVQWSSRGWECTVTHLLWAVCPGWFKSCERTL